MSEEGRDIWQDLLEDDRAGDQKAKIVGSSSSQSVSELADCCSSLFVSCCCEKLVAEAGDLLGTQSKGSVTVGSRY